MADRENWPQKSKAAFERIETHMRQRQWAAAIAEARAIGRAAQDAGKARVVVKAGDYLERLEDHVFAARLLAAGGLLKSPSPLPEWDGAPLGGRRLLIVQRIRHIGAPIRLSRLIALAAKRAGKCSVLAEQRLAPLFTRSFPGIDIYRAGPDDGRAYANADVTASYETLTEHLLLEDAKSDRLPILKADDDARKRFRAANSNGRPVIGVSWHSTNAAKDLPRLEDWGQFIGATEATFVSIQYGDVAGDVEKLRSLSGRPIIDDKSVDSLKNLDLFAAQVGALDAVVTVSNTGAHMAGALGVPTVVLLDDKNHLVWPADGRNSGWYRSVTLVRKQGREWSEVFGEARNVIEPALTLSDRIVSGAAE